MIEITMGELQKIALFLNNRWGDLQSEINLPPTQTMALIRVKKEIESQYEVLMETLLQIGFAAGGEPQKDGSLKIPEDKVQEVDSKVNEFAKRKISLPVATVKMRESGDHLPIELMDVLYKFIEVE